MSQQKQHPDYEGLLGNLTDMVQENCLKLGYRKEKVWLYYPMRTVEHILQVYDGKSELMDCLQHFSEEMKGKDLEITASVKGERICFLLAADTVERLYGQAGENAFLRAFIDTMSRHGISIEDIRQVFAEQVGEYQCRSVDTDEFDYVLWADHGLCGAYYYCVKFEGAHATYHRFLKKDYEEFGFSFL